MRFTHPLPHPPPPRLDGKMSRYSGQLSLLVHAGDTSPARHMPVPHVTPPGLENERLHTAEHGWKNWQELSQSYRLRWLQCFLFCFVFFLSGRGEGGGWEGRVRVSGVARFDCSACSCVPFLKKKKLKENHRKTHFIFFSEY